MPAKKRKHSTISTNPSENHPSKIARLSPSTGAEDIQANRMDVNDIMQQLLLGGIGGEYRVSLDENEALELSNLLDGELFQKMDAANRLCTFYSMCQNPLSAKISLFGPKILSLLKSEQDIDLLILLGRCLTNMIDSIPESGFPLLSNGLLEILCNKLSNLEYIDLAEQCIQCVEMLVLDYPKQTLRSKFLTSAVPFIDFHAITTQRKIFRITSICTKKFESEHYLEIQDVFPTFVSQMASDDKQISEYACVAVSQILENLNPGNGTLDSVLRTTNVADQFVGIITSPEFISKHSKQTVSLMLRCTSRIVRRSRLFFEHLLKSESFVSTLCDICNSHHEYLVDCSRVLLYLLPDCKEKLVCDYSSSKYSTLITDFISTSKKKEENSSRNKYFAQNKELYQDLVLQVLPQLLKNFSTIPDAHGKLICLQGLSAIIQSENLEFEKLFQDISISTFLADLLSSKNLVYVTTAIQIAEVLLVRLPNIFPQYFLREGIISEIEKILGSSSQDVHNKSPVFGILQNNMKGKIDKTPKKKVLKLQTKTTPKQKILGLLSRKKKSIPPPIDLSEPTTTNNIMVSIPKSSRLSNSKEIQFEELKEFCFILADDLLHKYIRNNSNTAPSELNILLKQIGRELLYPTLCKHALLKLKDLLHIGIEGVRVTNFEFIQSGIVESLLRFFENSTIDELKEFIHEFHTPVNTSEFQSVIGSSPRKGSLTVSTHLRELVRKLQECLSSEEGFQIFNEKFEKSPFRALQYLENEIVVSIERSRKVKGSVTFEAEISSMAPASSLMRELEKQIQLKSEKKIDKSKKSWTIVETDPIIEITQLEEEGYNENQLEIVDMNQELSNITNSFAIFGEELQIKKPISKYELYCEKSGHILKEDSPIFKELYFSSNSKKHPQKSNILSKHHTIKYRRKKQDERDPVSYIKGEYKYNSLIHQIKQTKIISRTFKDQSNIVRCLLQLLAILEVISRNANVFSLGESSLIPPAEFINSNLMAKVQNLMLDPFVVLSETIPSWVLNIGRYCRFLFSLELRTELFGLTSLGIGRKFSILQANIRNSEEPRVVISHQKIRVSRDQILQQAYQYFMRHPDNKGRLEVEFNDEVGTGNGPTNEFFSLISKELQRNSLNMWLSSDKRSEFVFAPNGLFPKPIDPRKADTIYYENIFHFLGRYLSRAIIDNRLTDISFSHTFLKALIGDELSFHDIHHIDPDIYKNICKLVELVKLKEEITQNNMLTSEEKEKQINAITLDGVSVQNLGQTFVLIGTDIELMEGGSEVEVTIHNLEQFIELTSFWYLSRGIEIQTKALREGFSYYSKVHNLKLFSDLELDILFSGENQAWSTEELEKAILCDHGYTSNSAVIEMLIQILSEFDVDERKAFLKFVTGSSRLPVGGLLHLNPMLTVVRKDTDGRNADYYLPSCMTCSHYLKLPEYTCKEIMLLKLKQAMTEGQNSFHLS